MKPTSWSFDAILIYEAFPPGAHDAPGVWVAGVTTFNQVSQGETAEQAMESLVSCLAVVGSWDLQHGRYEQDLFQVRRAGDVPIPSMQQTNGETRIKSAADATDKGIRYIVAGSVTLAEIEAVRASEQG